MNVLLSIKPLYAEKIINGQKKYEFRKSIFKNSAHVEKVFIYSSSPIKKIIGHFEIGEIVLGNPKSLWESCHEFAGISKKQFFEYFKNKEKGFAITIKNFQKYDAPIDPFIKFDNFKAPQSFYYVSDDFLDETISKS
jgi:type I restriction enzyme S subunit